MQREAHMNGSITPDELAQFTGTAGWFQHAINRQVHFSDGAKYVADRAGAYWLLDEIALIQPFDKRIAAEEFQVWKLKVNGDRTAQLTCEDGNDNVLYTKAVRSTDFTGDGITLWFVDNT